MSYYMPTISVRITDEERKKWLRYGPISRTVREAMEQYEKDRKKREFLEDLKKLRQEHPIQVDPDEIIRLIREDRRSH